MNTIFAIIFCLATLAIGIWVFWNVLDFIYRIVMIIFYSIAYVILTVWEILVATIRFGIVKPVTVIWNLGRANRRTRFFSKPKRNLG